MGSNVTSAAFPRGTALWRALSSRVPAVRGSFKFTIVRPIRFHVARTAGTAVPRGEAGSSPSVCALVLVERARSGRA